MSKIIKLLHKSLTGWKKSNEIAAGVHILWQTALIVGGLIILCLILGVLIDYYFGFKGLFLGITALIGVFGGLLLAGKLLLRFFDNENFMNEKE
jgi:F0F1-type ATP synthase assembly protein I